MRMGYINEHEQSGQYVINMNLAGYGSTAEKN